MTIEDLIRQIVADEVRRLLAERPATPDLVTIAAWARARSLSPSTARTAIREGRLECRRIGRSVRIPAGAEIAPRRERESVAERVAKMLGGRKP